MNQWHSENAAVLSLDGMWEFALDGRRGVIQVPGAWEAAGYGRRVDGPAQYWRTVFIPADWDGCQVQLQFDAVSYHAELSINQLPVGTHIGAWTPFAFDVTDLIQPGADNEIALTVYKPGERYPVRSALAGFLPDVALMFGGIWQSARLVALRGAIVSDLTVHPDPLSGTVAVRAVLDGAAGQTAQVTITDPEGQVVASQRVAGDDGVLAIQLAVPDPQWWSPERPALYTAAIALDDGAALRQTFGFRTLAADGDRLLFNGTPVCLRGTLNWGWYPDLLCPAPGDQTIREEFRRVRALGYNLMKLCLYVPSPRYFEIADREGMFLWLEFPMWLPEVTPHLRAQAPLEYADIVAAVRHHPSVVLYSLGCELDQAVSPDFLSELEGIVRADTHGVLLCDNSGSGEAYGSQPLDTTDFYDYHFYCDLEFFDPLVDHFRRDWRPPKPWIFGEFCDADDYRDMDELKTFFGGELPWWYVEQNPIHPLTKLAYAVQAERMERLDLGLSHTHLMRISRWQSLVIRKTILEKVRARSGIGGYVVTGLRDTPLATSSMFDDLGRSKYPAEAFRAFNADSVLLLARGRRRVWLRGGDRPAPAEPYCVLTGQQAGFDLLLAHAGAPLPAGTLTWQLEDAAGTVLAHDEVQLPAPAADGRPHRIGRAVFTVPPGENASILRLSAALAVEGRTLRNSWSLWAFPAVSAWPEGVGLLDPSGALAGLDDLAEAARRFGPDEAITARVLITSDLTPAVHAFLEAGGAVLLIQGGDGPLPAQALPFWRESLKLIGEHPLMEVFPHEGFVDLQFYGLATDWAFDTDRLAETLPAVTDVQPILRRLDARLFTLATYLFEARVGAGRLIATTLRVQGGLGDQPVGLRANLAGRWLLHAIVRYLTG